MSYPVNISFKDEEFAKVSKAAGDNNNIRKFVKDAAVEKAETIAKNKV
jgi:hypothetical protein